jgi:Transposase DDE domain
MRAISIEQCQPRHSALAITTALTLRGVLRLALRQTEGLIASIIALLGLDLVAPDHSTLSRRAETLEVPRPRSGRAPVHLLVDDSTGRAGAPVAVATASCRSGHGRSITG